MKPPLFNPLYGRILILVVATLLGSCRGESLCGQVDCTLETYSYLAEGGCDLKADVYSPPRNTATPAILWIHPGGLITGGRDWLDSDQLAIYLEAGYTVVAIDHRLAPEHKLETIISDVEAAYAWLVAEGPARFNIDPARVAIVGHSAGGYLALLAGYRVEPLPKALVAFYGYGDLTGEWATQPSADHSARERISHADALRALEGSERNCVPTGSARQNRFEYYVYLRQQGTWPLEVTGHDPKTEVAWFHSYEPVKNVTSDYPPTMLLHGRADRDVPFDRSALMVEKLESHGVESEWVTHSGWGHVFDQAGTQDPAVKQAFDMVIAFLDTHVR